MSLEVGSVVKGKVTGVMKFGAFVALPEDKSGMVHISEISHEFVNDINDVIKVGDEVTIMEGRVWFNNGMVQPVYRDLLMDLVEYESNEGWNYLREVPIPYNKA